MNPQPSPVPDLQLLTAAQVGTLLALDAKTVRTYARLGRIPPPIDQPGIGPRWRRSDIRRWLEESSAAKSPKRRRGA